MNIANWTDADRRSVVASAAITMGSVVKLEDDGAGSREATMLDDADAALLVSGGYGVAFKVAARADQVASSSGVPTRLGDRTVTIATGDQMLEMRKGSIIEYLPAELHDSLNPGQSGTLPAVGDALEIKDSLWCEVGFAGAITTVVAHVYDLRDGNVLVELDV